MASGRVLRFNTANGYGFIEPDDGGEDVFLHINDLGERAYSLQPGMRVAFNVVQSHRGLRAVDVEVKAPPPQSGPPSGPAAGPADPGPSLPRPAPRGLDEPDDGLPIDVVSASAYEREITDALIDTIGTVTAAEILAVRRLLVATAANRGWLE